jgi:Flp pilus assembly protein TadB
VNRKLLSGPLIGIGVALLFVAWLGLPRTVSAVAVAVTALYLAFFVRHLLFAVSALETVRADLVAPVIAPLSWP